MTIVLCTKGYPVKYSKNLQIKNYKKLKFTKTNFAFHAGTNLINNELVSTGGRVLNFTSIGKNFLLIRNKIISNIKKLNWKHGFFRRDIGWKVINKK